MRAIAYKRKERTDVTRHLAVEPTAEHGAPLPWDRGADLIRGGRLAMARGDGGDLRVLFHVGEPGTHPSDDWRDAFIEAGIAVCDRLFATTTALISRITRRDRHGSHH